MGPFARFPRRGDGAGWELGAGNMPARARGGHELTTRSLLMAIAILIGWAAQGPALAHYVLRAGDTIQISVWQEPRLDRQITIAPDGSIALPLAGRIQAGGRTAAQVQEAIIANLAPHYTDAVDVTVHLLAQPPAEVAAPVIPAIYVMGEVTRPGEFPILKQTTVLQAIALGGGLSPFAAEARIQVHRKAGGHDQIHVFDFRAFKYGLNPTGNIVLQAGDVVVVPERELFE